MLSHTSGRIFFLAALPSSDLTAFQIGRRRQSPDSGCLRSWESSLCRICSDSLFPSLRQPAPSGTIFFCSADSWQQPSSTSVCRLTAFPVFSRDCFYWCSSNVSCQHMYIYNMYICTPVWCTGAFAEWMSKTDQQTFAFNRTPLSSVLGCTSALECFHPGFV